MTDTTGSNPRIAATEVALIRRLYEAEQHVAAMSVPDRLAYRQCKPIVEELEAALTLAIHSCQNQWKELTAFLEDGAIPPDNNVSEREVKRTVLGRKNSLLAWNERGGQRAAILASITSTFKRHEIDPRGS